MALRQIAEESRRKTKEREKERVFLIGALPEPRSQEEMDYVINNGNAD